MRAMNEAEQFVHDRLATISAANQEPFNYSAGAAAYFERLAKACGQALAESKNPNALERFTAYMKQKFNDVSEGVPQEVHLTPPARAVAHGQIEQPQPSQSAQPQAARRDTEDLTAWPNVESLAELLHDRNKAPADLGPHYMAGQDIAAARRLQGLYQRGVARAIGLPPHYISLLEGGNKVADPEVYRRLRLVLKARLGAAP